MANTSQFAPIRTGLSKWKSMWNWRCLHDDERFVGIPITQLAKRERGKHQEEFLQIPADEPSLWKRLGFWKNSPEF
jgi:hypothetical protein